MTTPASFLTDEMRQQAIGLEGSGFRYGADWYLSGSRPEYEVMPLMSAFDLRGFLYRGDGWQLDTFPAPLVGLDFD